MRVLNCARVVWEAGRKLSMCCGALALLAGAAGAREANAQCIGYSVAPGPASFIPGTSDIGLYQDDGTLTISLPFNFNFYSGSFSSVAVSSNGNLQFGAAAPSTSFSNVCLPTTTFPGAVICPFWDDLYTAGGAAAGEGVFTAVSGAPGSQVFVIEWRTVYCCTGGAPINDFEVILYENQSFFDVVYSTPMSDRSQATVGCQAAGAAGSAFTQFVCNTAGPTSGTSLRFTCDTGIPGACCAGNGTCAVVANSGACGGTSVFGGSNSTCSGAGGTCPVATGACCSTTTGTCAYVAGAASCTTGSTYSGNGTVCTPSPCPNLGACCANTGACGVTTFASCTSPNLFQTIGSTCSGAGATCPGSVGACCNNTSGACTFVRGTSNCGTGNTYSGDGSACVPNVCPGPGSCCVTSTNLCTVTTQPLCTGIFSGPGTTCTTNPCPPPANDQCNGTLPALTVEVPFTGSNVNALTSYAPGDPYACGPAVPTSGGLRDVFHTFTAPSTGQYNADLCGSTFDTVLSVHTGCPATDANRIGCNDDSGANLTCTSTLYSRIPLLNLTGGVLYYFRVAGYNGGTGTYTLTVHAGSLDIGSCCAAGTGTCTETAQGTCTGTWTQGGICTNNTCPLTNGGACCTTAGGCTQTIVSACTAPSVWSSGASCATPVPCVPVGACCSAANACTTVTQPACAAGSTWALGGCTPVPCPLGGACCNNTTGACSTTQPGACGAGSTFQGNGIACSPNPCPQPPAGVCCRGSTCNTTITSAGACTGSLIGGQVAGATFPAGAVCNAAGNGTTPCCLADYNKVSGITVQDIFDFLQDWFAGSPYANTGGNGNPGPLAVQNIFDFLTVWFTGGC